MIYRKGKSKKDADRIVNKWTQRWIENVIEVVREEMLSSFDKERHSHQPNTKWAQLRPSTQKQRAWLGYNPDHPILFRTGDLRDNIDVAFIMGGQEIKVPMGKANKIKLGWIQGETRQGGVRYSKLLNAGLTGYKLGGLQKIKARNHLEIPNKFLNMDTRMELTDFYFYFNEMLLDLRAKVYKLR